MTERLGHYDLVRHLATGGMAEIYVARQSGPGGFDRELAIKKILPHLAREERFVSMFLDEARIASRLRHPNIVQIYELGEASGEYFIAMEYIEGWDLADILDKAEERAIDVPIAMSVRIIADVLAALDYAHEFAEDGKPLQIVHRDVSPHNVLLGQDGMIKLVDFGIAHAVERRAKTETGLVKGKLSYMAPEQIEQEALDRRADIFSAGVLLYELLAGETPFGRELAAVSAILTAEMPDPRKLRPDIPDELVPVLQRSLAKKPADRYQSAQEMLEDLESVLRAFDKYVSPKHVANFAARLVDDLPIEGYDDVSQAIPRTLSRRAFAEATTAVDTPAGLKPKTSTEPPATTASTSTEHAPGAPAPEAMGETEESGEDSRPVLWFAIPGGLIVLVAIGLTLGTLSASSDPVAPEKADVEEKPTEPTVIELADQVVALDDAEGVGFYFDEDEVHLAELEMWVSGMEPEQVDAMLAANFELDDGEYLWTVRAPKLAARFSRPPDAVNPGDPMAPKLLGLENLDEDVVKPKPRRRPRPRVRRRASTKQVETVPKAERGRVEAAKAPAASSADQNTTKRDRSRRKKEKDDDLRIIDKAVPY